MGKKSLIKSTSKKKKTTSTKKDEDKKTKVAKKADAKKAKAGKKVEAKKKPAAKTASDKALTLKDLIFKKFEREIPEKLFKVEAEERVYTAPPIISTTDKKEADRLKKLLFKKLDLVAAPEKRPKAEKLDKPKEEKKKAEKPVKEKKAAKADYKEIMARKFHQPPSAEVLAESPYKQVVKDTDAYTAPPLISSTDIKEAERLKRLLFRKMDLTTPPEPKIEEPDEKKKPEPVKVAEVKEEIKPVEVKKEVKPVEVKEEVAPVIEKEVKKADYKEVMARKFHEPQPAAMAAEGMEKKKEDYTAPPWISTDDPKEAARIREILFRQFEIPPAPVEPEVSPIVEKEPEARVAEAIEPEFVPEPFEPGAEAAKAESVEEAKEEKAASEAEKEEKEEKGPKVTVTYDEPPPTHTEVSDPMDKMIKFVAAGVILLVLVLIGYSFNNKSKYYIQPSEDGIEILQGRFAPMGEDVLARLSGVTPPENIKDVYKAEEVLPIAFAYYVDQADNLLNVKGIPDLKEVKTTLDKALSFALTKEERDLVQYRLNSMERHVLQYRANVAASRGTPEDVAIAIGILSDALKTDMDEQQKSMIQSRIEYLKEYREQLLSAQEAQKTEAPVEETEAAQEQKVTEEKGPEAAPAAEEKSHEEEGESHK